MERGVYIVAYGMKRRPWLCTYPTAYTRGLYVTRYRCDVGDDTDEAVIVVGNDDDGVDGDVMVVVAW